MGDAYYQAYAAFRPWAARNAPAQVARRLRIARSRQRVDAILAGFESESAPLVDGPILIDGMFDNPNYWLRYALFRTALGCRNDDEVGVVFGPRAGAAKKTFRRFGVGTVLEFADYLGERTDALETAGALVSATKTPDDILEWSLPFDYPAGYFYDSLLKRQAGASVDIDHPQFASMVAEGVRNLHAADAILEQRDFRLVVLSGKINTTYGAIGWRAVQRGIPVVIINGEYGQNYFWRPDAGWGFYDFMIRPTPDVLASMDANKVERLAEAGKAFLEKRRSGDTKDFAATNAFGTPQTRIDKDFMANYFGWTKDKPIVAVYGGNWYDFPHTYGLGNFRDIYDWVVATVSVAERCDHVYWLFKGHPSEPWYGGPPLDEIIPHEAHGHIGLAPSDWNGAAVQEASDALVMVYSTAGVETAAIGKPVLIADRGWYHDCGFVKWSETREEYLESLQSPWWEGLDLEAASFRANVFAGWYFCCPKEQLGFLQEDNTLQDDLYDILPDIIESQRSGIAWEIDEITDWFASGHKDLHTFKLTRCDDFAAPYV